MATYDRVSAPPLSQQMDAEEPVIESKNTAGFDPICNFYAYNGNVCQCLYDVFCPFCLYGDNRVIDEVLEGLPGTLDLPEARTISVGLNTNTPICCLPGCTKHCLFLSIGMLPSLATPLFGTILSGLDCFLSQLGAIYMSAVGGMNRKRLRDKYKITQPKCVVAGCSFEHMEPYCCWYWNPAVWGQEARFLRRKFKEMTENQIDVMY
jgi:hypothetical protein